MDKIQDYAVYYNSLEKPFFSPPDFVFGLAWGIIYPLIGLAAVWMFYLAVKNKIDQKLIMLFVMNMIGNIMFSPIQFILQNNILASFCILYVFATLSWFQMLAIKQSKLLFILMLPYWIWIIFATFLQLIITWINLF